MSVSVMPNWMLDLPIQQQSVLFLSCRGPDGVKKFHECKHVVRAYRATVLVAAYRGRQLYWGEAADNFMSLEQFADDEQWKQCVDLYFETIDELPHHYHMHLVHGAQILGFKHPDIRFRERWNGFYERAVHDAHLNIETMEQMDERLNDWGRRAWEEES